MAKSLLQSVIEEHITDFHAHGPDLVGTCPKCQEQKFSYAPSRDFWWCWKCRTGGKLEQFRKHTEEK
jgi:hypothetical protein